MNRKVVPDCSMYGRKLTEYLPCSSSGISHQDVPASTAAAHFANRVSRSRPLALTRMNMAGKIRT